LQLAPPATVPVKVPGAAARRWPGRREEARLRARELQRNGQVTSASGLPASAVHRL